MYVRACVPACHAVCVMCVCVWVCVDDSIDDDDEGGEGGDDDNNIN